MLSIFQNICFCSSIDSSQMEILWRKKYTSEVLLRKFFIPEERSILIIWDVSFSTFYTYRLNYVSKLIAKEKELCMCNDCLNPHLLLNLINAYQKSINLYNYQSLTSYVNKLKVDGNNYDLFPETKGEKSMILHLWMETWVPQRTRWRCIVLIDKASIILDRLLPNSSMLLET